MIGCNDWNEAFCDRTAIGSLLEIRETDVGWREACGSSNALCILSLTASLLICPPVSRCLFSHTLSTSFVQTFGTHTRAQDHWKEQRGLRSIIETTNRQQLLAYLQGSTLEQISCSHHWQSLLGLRGTLNTMASFSLQQIHRCFCPQTVDGALAENYTKVSAR